MIGRAESYGAITVVNAIPSGRGSTIGIDLRTTAEFEPVGRGLDVKIVGHDPTDDRLARICAENMHIALGRPCHGLLRIDSEIPTSRGLKSSSSAANAICLAIARAYSSDMDEMDIIRIGCESSIEAGVSITGAFDDACGCHFGGIVSTDNLRMVVEAMLPYVGDHGVLIHVPERMITKKSLNVEDFRSRWQEFDEMVLGCMADPFRTLTKNGRIVAEILGLDDSLAQRAIDAGALAAGVTGTGPAIAIIASEEVCNRIIDEEPEGEFIITSLRCAI